MKLLIGICLFLLLVPVAGVSATEAALEATINHSEAKDTEKVDPVSKLDKYYDDVEKIAVYYSPDLHYFYTVMNIPHNFKLLVIRPPLDLRILEENGEYTLVMLLKSTSLQGIGLNSAKAHFDGETAEFTLHEQPEIYSDGAIYEKVTQKATTNDIAIIKRLIVAEKALIRFSGARGYVDRYISKDPSLDSRQKNIELPNQQKALQNVLDAYEALIQNTRKRDAAHRDE